MQLLDFFKCIYYNTLANFYIIASIIFPYYNEEILNLQYKTIECINEDIIFQCNSRKRKRFNMFVENLINKNNDLIDQIRRQEEEDNNLENYEKIQDSGHTYQMDASYNEILDESSDTSDTISDDDSKKNN